MQKETGGGVENVTGMYKTYMDLTAWQWLNYGQFWADSVRGDLAKGKLTQSQVDAIWKSRESRVKTFRDSQGNDATIPPPPVSNEPSSWEKFKESLNILDNIDDIKNSLTGGSSKYVVLGIVGVVLIIILGRK